MNNTAKDKARNLRYKKAALARLNIDTIQEELFKIAKCVTLHVNGIAKKG